MNQIRRTFIVSAWFRSLVIRKPVDGSLLNLASKYSFLVIPAASRSRIKKTKRRAGSIGFRMPLVADPRENQGALGQ